MQARLRHVRTGPDHHTAPTTSAGRPSPLVGETFAAAFEDRRQFRGDDADAARAWLYGIGRNKLSDYFRRGGVERRALTVLGVERRPLTDEEYDRIENLAPSAELRPRVADGLSALPAEQQQACV